MVVGYVVSSLYKKEEKKQKERRINKRPVDRKTSEEIFKELQKSLQPQKSHLPEAHTLSPKPIESKQKSTQVAPKQKLTRLSSQWEKPKRQSLKDTYKKRKGSDTLIVAETPAATVQDDSYRPDFDLRKAVLYSEMLKRPQY